MIGQISISIDTILKTRMLETTSFQYIFEELGSKVPPKQTGYLEYFKNLNTLYDDNEVSANKIAASLWLALFRPSSVPSLADYRWNFRIDDSIIAIMQKLLIRGLIGAGDSIDITRVREDGGEADIVESIDIIDCTVKTLYESFDVKNSTSGAEIKLVQFLLTASTAPVRAINGKLLALVLGKLAEVFLFSKQAVNKNVAKASIMQIVSERIDESADSNNNVSDQETVFHWLCEVVRSSSCPLDLGSLVLEMIHDCLKENKSLFKSPEGPLSQAIKDELLHTIIGPNDRVSTVMFSHCIEIIKILIKNYFYGNCESIEIILHEFFSLLTLLPEDNQNPNSIIRPHFRPFANKIIALNFFCDTIFADEQVLFDCFLNFDAQENMSNIVEGFLVLVNAFVETDRHQIDGNRIPGSPYSDRHVELIFKCANTVQKFMSCLLDWHSFESGKEEVESVFMTLERKSRLQPIIDTFNKSPLEGIIEATENGFIIKESLESVAKWLRSTRGLSKTAIGEYLGSVKNTDLLYAYADTFDFSGMSFVSALRIFLESFRIPGESQVIERFLEQFSRRLVDTDPDTFQDEDMLFQITYSTLMLNTDMYSSNVRDKMTRAAFIKNTLGAIDKGKGITEEILVKIYEEIATIEIQLYSQSVEHPLPVGSRLLKDYQKCNNGFLLKPMIHHTSLLWSRIVDLCLEKMQIWPEKYFEMISSGSPKLRMELPEFENYGDFVTCLLSGCTDLIKLTCRLEMAKERHEVLIIILSIPVLKPHYQRNGNNNVELLEISGLKWLNNICQEYGSSLGDSWNLVISVMSEWDLSTMVDDNHNIIEIDLSKLDGSGLLYFFSALIDTEKETVTSKSFCHHYAERFQQLPSSILERLVRYSYENPNVERLSFFTLISNASDDEIISDSCFGILQRVAREQLPIIVGMSDDATFEFLRALEKFGLLNDAAKGMETVETFLLIGNLLYSQHKSIIMGDEGGTMAVGEDKFFLKWYHILSGLSRIAAEQLIRDVARVATQSLYKLIREQGECYSEGAWKVIWRSILLPLLEEFKLEHSQEEIYIKLMEWSIELVTLYKEKLMSSHEILENLVRLLVDMIETEPNPSSGGIVAEYGIKLTTHLILNNHEKIFRLKEWKLVTDAVVKTFEYYTPEDLTAVAQVNEEEDESYQSSVSSIPTSLESIARADTNNSMASINFPANSKLGYKRSVDNIDALSKIARKCSMQLLFLDMINDLAIRCGDEKCMFGANSFLDITNAKRWLEILLRSYEVAFSFNANIQLRETMVKAGFAENLELLVLIKQETLALIFAIEIYHKIFMASLKGIALLPALVEDEGGKKELAQRYLELSTLALQRYVEMKQPNSIFPRPGKSWKSLTANVLVQWRQTVDVLFNTSICQNFTLQRLAFDQLKTKVALGLEIYRVADANSSVLEAARELISVTTSKLLTGLDLSDITKQ